MCFRLNGGGSLVFVASTIGRSVRSRLPIVHVPTARDALDLLRDQGVRRIVMLTGDRPDSARRCRGARRRRASRRAPAGGEARPIRRCAAMTAR